jgi:hypothetical protein
MRAAVLAVLVACGGAKPAAPGNTTPVRTAEPTSAPRTCSTSSDDDAANLECTVSQMDIFKMQMCTCLDRTCADRVNDAMMKWSQDMAKTASRKTPKVDSEAMKRMTDSTQMYSECYTSTLMQQPTPAAATPANPCSP